MDIPGLLERYSLTDFAAGLGGCRNGGGPYGCCEYDVFVFDERDEADTIVEYGGETAAIHHCSLSETRSGVLVRFSGMEIIRDDAWDLRMALARIGERRGQIYRDSMRDCLIDSLFCITKFREGAGRSDPLAPCWIKCAAIYLADAVLLDNMVRPSPAHFMREIRRLGAGKANAFSAVNECMGMERASSVLLERMSKSTVGFSDMVEGNGNSGIICSKAGHLAGDSLFTDCYFYLGYMNRNNMVRIKDRMAAMPGLAHVLKVAMDTESDPSVMERQASMLYEAASAML